MRDVIAIVDLQFGSTGKGQIAGTLAHAYGPDTVVTAWGPNAGHTFRMRSFKMVTTMLATSSIAPSVRNVLIGPGSVVRLSSLMEEITAVRASLEGKRLIIHPRAVLWVPAYAEAERQLVRIGSTMKGTGEALIDKVRRNPLAVCGNNPGAFKELTSVWPGDVTVDERDYDSAIDTSKLLMVEGSQGFSLGVHTGFYPHCTSRDISTTQLLADCRVPFPGDSQLETVGVCRTYPIRVANRFDEQGNLVGTSGGCYPDQQEIEWRTLHREPELTTVTKLPRRIFTFSHEQIRQAIRICRPRQIALTFCDYIEPAASGEGDGRRIAMGESVSLMAQHIDWTAKTFNPCKVKWLSYGPNMTDVYERYDTEFIRPVWVP